MQSSYAGVPLHYSLVVTFSTSLSCHTFQVARIPKTDCLFEVSLWIVAFLKVNEHVNALLLVITVGVSVLFVSNNTVALAHQNLGNLQITDVEPIPRYSIGLALTLHHCDGLNDSSPFLLKIHLWSRLRSRHN